MEMENSLNQLDEYLERIGGVKSSFGEKNFSVLQEQEDENATQEQGDERDEQEKSKRIEDTDIGGKSSESFTVVRLEKSINFKDNEESFEKSNTFTRDFTPKEHNSIDSYPEACISGDNVFSNGQLESDKDVGFGDETSVFRITDNQSNFIENVKSESLHFEESEEVVNELAEIGLSEENLQKFALSGTTSSMSQKVDLDSVPSTLQVHPVSLKKSTTFSEKSVTSKRPKGQVTTLLDLSSIGELKRLWAKSPKKKPGTRSTGKSADGKVSKHASSDEKEMKQSTQDIDKTVFQITTSCNAEIGLERNRREKEITNMLTCHTKQCSVKLVRVEGLTMPENLKIDLSIPKKGTVSDNSSDCKKVSGRCKEVSSKNCDKLNEGVKGLVANSLKRISAKSKSMNVDLKIKLKKQVGPKAVAQKSQKNSTSVNDRPLQFKAETEKTGMNEDTDPDNDIPYEWLSIGNEDSSYEQDDDYYIPSDDDNDDDYKPKKKRKKTKAKKVHSVKCEKVEIKEDNLNSNVSVRSSGKKRKGTRIGRPPVFGHFECKFCDFTANEKNLVDKHHYKCHRMVLTCQDCEKVFRSVNGLWEHQAYKHDGGKPFKCEHEGCDYASKNPTDLDRHKAKHETELKHVCDICGWRTKWRRNMRHHHTLKHCDERNYKCTICEFAAKRPYDLKEHMYRHSDEKPIQCLVCGFRVKTNYELRSHMLVHSNEKPFKCIFPGCSGATKTRADLTKHMRVHQTERPFKCHICLKSYKDQHALNKHITGIHVDQRRYKCDICGKYFKNKYALRKHMYLHAGHKPHECPVCQWKFSTRSNMEKHMVTHDTNERPYPCPLCPHAAKQPDHLLAHIGTVHGDKYAYFCELCNKPFKRYMQLKLHYERMHTEKEVKKLNSSTVDLALLKMEMSLELEEREGKNGKRKKRKSRSKSKTLSDIDIKEEPVDEEYSDVVNSEECDINDVRLDEDTGKIEVVKRNVKVGKLANESNCHNAEIEPEPDFVEDGKVDKHKNGKGVAVELPQTLNSSTIDKSEVDQVAEGNKNGNRKEDEIVVSDSDADDVQLMNGNNENSLAEEEKFDSEDLEKKKDNILIAKDDVSTVALYENFRLPLATKGFKFNYNKNGTKPMKAWFMDVSLMDRQTAEKHKKHRRRLGLLPPIPRGHPPKGYKRLQSFVDKRKKQLAVNIKKAKFVKDLGLVSKRNVSRAKRFPGKYTEFETVDGEALSVTQVQNRLPKLEYPIKKERSTPLKQKAKKIPPAKKTQKHATNTKKPKVKSVTSEKQNKTAKTKATVKKETTKNSGNKKKVHVVTKKASPKSSKLLLSSEKKKPGRPKATDLKIRKPIFLEKGSEDISVPGTSNRNSFAALESILSEFSQSSSASVESESTNLHETARKQKRKYKANPKTKTRSVNIKKQKSKLSRKSNAKEQVKPKYNKKYVPVKQPVKRKNNLSEKNSKTKKFKPTDVVTDTGESSSVEQNIQGHVIFQPTNVHLPVQNSQFVMVYPASVLQTENIPESNEISGDTFFVTVNDNSSYIREEASQMERLDLQRNLNDVLTDSYTGCQELASGHNASKESDKVLMQKEYTETVLVKEEPCTDVTYYTSLAQQSSV